MNAFTQRGGDDGFGHVNSSSITKSGDLRLSIHSPMAPDARDPKMMASFELCEMSVSPKARMVMKMDMVKPMPPRKPAPSKSLQSVSSGNFARRNFTAKNEN